MDDLDRFLALLWRPGEVREVRIPKYDRRNTASGYFDDPTRMAEAVRAWDGKGNVYVTLNPCVRAVMSREQGDRIDPRSDTATSARDILERRWLLVDIDPERPTGVASTEAERELALTAARAIAEHLHEQGWGWPLTTMSGNGHGLLYPVQLPNDDESTGLAQGFLRYLGGLFDVPGSVKVDQSVYDPNRITACIGTLKRKGRDTPERPHRRTALVYVPADLEPIPLAALRRLAPPEPTRQAEQQTGDRMPPGWVRDWLDANHVVYRVKQRGGRDWYNVESCPWHPDEDPWRCGATEAPDGTAGYKCQHARGAGKGWRDYREAAHIEPPAGFTVGRSAPGPTPGPDPMYTPPNTTATVQPPPLASTEDILGAVARTVAAMGMAGEGRAVKLVYLVVTTRLLDRIVSMAIKGPSSAGKSFLVEKVLDLFPASAYHALSAMSEHALIYDDTDVRHRFLVIYEAAGLNGDITTYIIRSLLSEGRIRYTTVEKVKGGLRGRTIDRPGPTGLLTTTTEIRLHPENETRLLSLTVSDDPKQTAAILRAHALGTGEAIDLEPWHRLQDWLAAGPCEVAIPYLVTLAEAIPPVAVRLRRDFPAVASLVRAHALLHRATRETDETGAIVATIGDYAAVRELVADLVADAAERSVPATVRETVRHVATLTLAGGETTVVAIGAALGIDKSAASRRVRAGLDRGYLRNLEDKRGRPARIALGDPLPEEQTVLPEAAELERLHAIDWDAAETAGDDSQEAA